MTVDELRRHSHLSADKKVDPFSVAFSVAATLRTQSFRRKNDSKNNAG